MMGLCTQNTRRAGTQENGRGSRETMGQVIALCTSDETDDNGYNKSTVEKVRSLQTMKPNILSFFFSSFFGVEEESISRRLF